MVARADARAGGLGSARQQGGPQAQEDLDVPSRHPEAARRPERDARREADRDRLDQAARALLTTDGWQRWIRVRATNGLSRYSVGNQLLIASDCYHRGITPTYVAGFRAFLDLNRCVRKGEKAIKILAPCVVKPRDDEENGEKRVFFRTVPVFDVSMTDPLPGCEPVPLGPPSQPLTGDSHAHLVEPLTTLAAELGFTVETRELPEHGPRGWCDPKARRIVIAAGAANAQVRTLVHEIAHALGIGYTDYGRDKAEVLVDSVVFWRARPGIALGGWAGRA